MHKGRLEYYDYPTSAPYIDLANMLHLEFPPIFCRVDGLTPYLSKYEIPNATHKIELEVPSEFIKFTDYFQWSDYKFYRNSDSVDTVTYDEIKRLTGSLSAQRDASEYSYPQAVIQEIKPEWVLQVTSLQEVFEV